MGPETEAMTVVRPDLKVALPSARGRGANTAEIVIVVFLCCVEFRRGGEWWGGTAGNLEPRFDAAASTSVDRATRVSRLFCRVSTGKLISPGMYFCTGTHRAQQPL
jgi:hypothetical protein